MIVMSFISCSMIGEASPPDGRSSRHDLQYPAAVRPMILTELECSGRFRIVRPIRDETVASVYEAELLGAEGFSKRVALKVITPAFAHDPEFLLAFLRETTLSANLMHGNIVQTYQLGEADGEYFVAMELIHGPSLRMIVDRHREKGR